MPTFEYKTTMIEYPKLKAGWFRRPLPELEPILNREARNGWRLKQVLQPAEGFGYTTGFIAIFERESDPG